MIRRLWLALCAGAEAAVSAAKWSWQSSSPDYVPEDQEAAHRERLREERQKQRERREQCMRPIYEKMLRDALRGPYAPKEITPEA